MLGEHESLRMFWSNLLYRKEQEVGRADWNEREHCVVSMNHVNLKSTVRDSG